MVDAQGMTRGIDDIIVVSAFAEEEDLRSAQRFIAEGIEGVGRDGRSHAATCAIEEGCQTGGGLRPA